MRSTSCPFLQLAVKIKAFFFYIDFNSQMEIIQTLAHTKERFSRVKKKLFGRNRKASLINEYLNIKPFSYVSNAAPSLFNK